jgi:hypothetical protein
MNKNSISEKYINELNKLESFINIKIFKKDNILRNKIKVINECNKMKKKKLLELINNLKNMVNGTIDINTLKEYHNNAIQDINNCNNIINIINYIIECDDNCYIEIYSNTIMK